MLSTTLIWVSDALPRYPNLGVINTVVRRIQASLALASLPWSALTLALVYASEALMKNGSALACAQQR